MRIFPLVIAYLVLLEQANAYDILRRRFTDATIAAVREAKDCIILTWNQREQPPPTGYDKAKEKEIIDDVLRWLEEHSKTGKPLSEASINAFIQLFLHPENHYQGGFNFGEPNILAVKFKSNGKIGYILLSDRTGTIFWDDRSQCSALTKEGEKALRQWIKENG